MRLALLLLLAGFAAAQATPLEEAAAALKRGDYGEALRVYESYLARDPASYEAGLGLARALAFAGQRDQAITAYTALLARYPADPDLHLGRGRVYAWEGRYSEAGADLAWVAAQFPGYADAWSALGDLHLWSGKPAAAAAAYDRWVALQPDDPAPYLARGRAWQAGRRFPRARADLLAARRHGGDPVVLDALLRALDRTPAPAPWEMTLGQQWGAGRTLNAGLQRTFGKGSLSLAVVQTARFSQRDEALVLDRFADLWRRGYGNFRLQTARNAQVLPRLDLAVEVFQGIGSGWEVSAAVRRLAFAAEQTHILAVSMARYAGEWYLRARTSLVPGSGKWGFSQTWSGRRYIGKVDNLLEAGAGGGRSVVVLPTGPQTRRTWFSSLRGQWFFSRVGLSLSAGYENPNEGAAFALSLLTRW